MLAQTVAQKEQRFAQEEPFFDLYMYNAHDSSEAMSTGQGNIRTRYTLQDVADMAGVSATTVSVVLAGNATKRRISEDTYQRVRGAAAALGYTPNLLHRSLRRGRTNVISLYNAFRNREWSDLYMDRLSSAVEHAGGTLGYDVLVHCNFQRDTTETYEFLNGGLADGLILFGPLTDDPLLPLLRNSNLPTVLVGSRGEPTLPSVNDDEVTGIRLAAEALVARGHRKIAAVVPKNPIRVQRLQGELTRLGVELPDAQVIPWNDSPRETVANIQKLSSSPTALFVWHDRTAYCIAEACVDAGIRVPQDLSIVGYDGLVWPSTTGHVIASVVVPLDRMAQAAVRILDRQISGEATPSSETIPVTFSPGTTLIQVPDGG